MMHPGIFLDRDGVLIRSDVRDGKPFAVMGPEDMVILPGVKPALETLKHMGFKLIVITNQPDVATGKQKKGIVEAMNAQLQETLRIDAFKTCYHVDADDCTCRKPKPGMIIDAAREWDVDLEQSFMIGDRWRDIDAGRAAGCKTLFIDYGYNEPAPVDPDFIVGSLMDAAQVILELPQGPEAHDR